MFSSRPLPSIMTEVDHIHRGKSSSGEDVVVTVYRTGHFDVKIGDVSHKVTFELPLHSPSEINRNAVLESVQALDTPPRYIEVPIDESAVLSDVSRAKLMEITSILTKTIINELYEHKPMKSFYEVVGDLNHPDDYFQYLGELQHNGSKILLHGDQEHIRVYVQDFCSCNCLTIPSSTGVWHHNPDYVPDPNHANRVSLSLVGEEEIIITDLSNGAQLHLKCTDELVTFDPAVPLEDLI